MGQFEVPGQGSEMMSRSSHICPGDLVIITNFAPEYNPERVGIILNRCIPYKNGYKYAVLTDRGEEFIEDVFLFNQEPCQPRV